MNYRNTAVVSVLASVMAGCAYLPEGHSSRSTPGRFDASNTEQLFTSDGSEQANVTQAVEVANPVSATGLRVRKSKRGNMDSYVVRGQRYFTMDSSDGYSARGLASWYGPNFHGRIASNGEVYDMYKMTAAHKTLPLPTYARVTHIDSGKAIVVKINDRGPFSGDRLIDLSFAAALELGMVNDGTAMVQIQALSAEELVVLSGPKNKLGVDFFYDAGPAEKNKSLPVTELFTDAEPVINETQSASVAVVPVVVPDGQYVPIEPVLVAEAESAEAVNGTVIDVAALGPEYLEVVVPGREREAANAPLSDNATELPLAVGESSQPVSVAAIKASDDLIPEAQRVVVPLISNSGLGDSLAAVVPAVRVADNKPVAVSDVRYYIQAGVFADVLDAEKIAVDIVLKIPSEEVHVKPLKDSHMYRITVGPIVSNDHAKEVSAKLIGVGIDNYTVKVKEI